MPISSRNKSLLQEGIANRKIVRIRYKKEDKEFKKPKPFGRKERGDIVVRNLEPYEIDDNYFWGLQELSLQKAIYDLKWLFYRFCL